MQVVTKAAAAVGSAALALEMHVIVLGRYVRDDEVLAPLLVRDCATRDLQPKVHLVLLPAEAMLMASA